MKHKISKYSFDDYDYDDDDDDNVNHSHIPKFVYNSIFSVA
jgi:hypothetical protein